MDEKPADENLVELFQQWLSAFEVVQAAICEDEAVAQREVLARPRFPGGSRWTRRSKALNKLTEFRMLSRTQFME